MIRPTTPAIIERRQWVESRHSELVLNVRCWLETDRRLSGGGGAKSGRQSSSQSFPLSVRCKDSPRRRGMANRSKHKPGGIVMRIGAAGLFALIGTMAICGCDRSSPSVSNSTVPEMAGALSPSEETQISRTVAGELVGRMFWTGPSTRANCGDFFTIGIDSARVVDRRISGRTGELKIGVPVTALQAMPAAFDDRSPTRQCLGVSSAFNSGQTINVLIDRDIERWDSGWRLGERRQAGTTGR